jgi:hypothetical protein
LSVPLAPGAAAAAVVATAMLCVAFTLGRRFRATAPAFALALLWITSYRNSWGHLSHGDNLVVLHVLVLSFSPAADAWSLDAAARGRRHAVDPRYGWPLRLMAVVTVATYVLAGWSKLRFGGAGWIGGDAVRLHIAFDAVRKARFGVKPSGIAGLLLPHAWAFVPVGIATLCIELGAPLALVSRRAAAWWASAAIAMHVGIAAVMGLVFAYPLALVAFAPLFRVERALAYARRRVCSPYREFRRCGIVAP